MSEILPPVANAAANVGKKLLNKDPNIEAQLARMAEETREMQAADLARAKRTKIKQAIRLKLLQPWGFLVGAQKEYFNTEFENDLAGKLKDVPEEDLVEPKPVIGMPTMQNLGMSLDEPALKDMYLNLLATASVKKTASDAHPAFADIIRQLSADESHFLSMVLTTNNGVLPIIRVKTKVPGSEGFHTAFKGLLNVVNPIHQTKKKNTDLPRYIDNWVRLGLVQRDYSLHLTAVDQYKWADDRPEVQELRTAGSIVEFDKGILQVTDFGLAFSKAVDMHAQVEKTRKSWRALEENLRRAEQRLSDLTEKAPPEPQS